MKLYTIGEAKGVCVGGTEYVNDADGAIDVPAEYADVVIATGYAEAPTKQAAKPSVSQE